MAIKEINIDNAIKGGTNKESTFLYDSLVDHITEASKNRANMMQLQRTIVQICEKNSDVLYTNIVGLPILVNEKDQANILKCLDLTKKELQDLCLKSPRLDGIGKIIDQFAFALPLLILSGVLYKQGQEQFSKGIFKFIFFRPYASKVGKCFNLGVVDEKAMEYTTVVELDNKSFIHKYGSVDRVLEESAKSAYNTYIDQLAATNGSPTDDMVYNNIFYSAIFSKTGSWITSLYLAYKAVKASGKALTYELSTYKTTDEDSGEDEYEENNIRSNSALKREIVSKAVTKFNIAPVDTKLITFASTYGNGSPSKVYETFLKSTIDQIADSKIELIPSYFDAIIGAYLDSYDVSGELNKPTEIKTSKFLAYSKRIFKVSHTDNSNIKEEQRITEDLLVSCSPKYSTAEIKTKRKMKLALYMYFILFIQKA